MERRFSRHYTLEEARALLPALRRWLQRLRELSTLRDHIDAQLAVEVREGRDLGGERVNRALRILVEMNGILEEFDRREIQLQDLDRGLVDFPSLQGGSEIFLCWEEEEEDICFWHGLGEGYAGRSRL